MCLGLSIVNFRNTGECPINHTYFFSATWPYQANQYFYIFQNKTAPYQFITLFHEQTKLKTVMYTICTAHSNKDTLYQILETVNI